MKKKLATAVLGLAFGCAAAQTFDPLKPFVSKLNDGASIGMRDYEAIDRAKGDLRLKYIDLSFSGPSRTSVELVREYRSGDGNQVSYVDNQARTMVTPGGAWRFGVFPELKVMLQDKVENPPDFVVQAGGRYELGAKGFRDILCGLAPAQHRGRPLQIHAYLYVPGEGTMSFSTAAGSWSRSEKNWQLSCELALSGDPLSLRVKSPDGIEYDMEMLAGPHWHSQATQWFGTRKYASGQTVATVEYRQFRYSDFGSPYGEVITAKPQLVRDENGAPLMSFAYMFRPDLNNPESWSYSDPAPTAVVHPGGTVRYEYYPLDGDTKGYYSAGLEVRQYPLKSMSHEGTTYRWSYEYGDAWLIYRAEGENRGNSRLRAIVEPNGGRVEYTWANSPIELSMLDKTWISTCVPGIGWEGTIAGCVPNSDSIRAIYQLVSSARGRVVERRTSDGGLQRFSYSAGQQPGGVDVSEVTYLQGSSILGYSRAESIGWSYFSRRPITPNEIQVIQNFAPVENKGWMLGLVTKVEVLDAARRPVQTTNYAYDAIVVSSGSRWILGPTWFKDAVHYRPALSRIETTRDGVSYLAVHQNFDAYGNPGLVVERGPGGARTTTYTYRNQTGPWVIGRVESETVEGAGTVRREWSAWGNLLSESIDGVTTSHTYYANGDLQTTTKPRGLTTTFSSYRRGIAQTERQPEDVTLSRAINASGLVSSETNGEGYTTSFLYDAAGRVTRVSPPLGSPTVITYTASTKSTERGQKKEVTNFDGFGRVASTVVDGHVTSFRYDSLGRQTWRSIVGYPSIGHAVAYDMLGRVILQTHSADGSSKKFSYASAAGLATIRLTDERNFSREYRYRAFSNPDALELMAVIAPSPHSASDLQITRNGRGLVTSIAQGGLVRTFRYDTRNLLETVEHPETGTTRYRRDDANNVLEKSVGGSSAIVYVYDNRNRLTSVSYPSGYPSTARTTYTKTDKIKTAVNADTSREFFYDANDNVVQEVLTVDGIRQAAGYGYNDRDQLASITYPVLNRVAELRPDTQGRSTEVRMPAGWMVTTSYWPNGDVYQHLFNGGATATYGRSGREWIDSMVVRSGDGVVRLSSTLTYDVAGNLLSVTDSVDSSFNRTYTYDEQDRLITANGPWGTGRIEYDGGNNIRSYRLGGTTLAYSYDSRNRLAAFTTNGTAAVFMGYDTWGNETSGPNAGVFDNAGNLRRTGAGAQYTYDAQNKRVKVVSNGLTTYEFWSHGGQLLTQLRKQACCYDRLLEHLYVAGRQVAVQTSDISGGSVVGLYWDFTQTDAAGSPISGAWGGGNTFKESYRPFGERVDGRGQGALVWFTGHKQDAEQLIYMQGRYYNPKLGRFLSIDPEEVNAGDPYSFNRYAYANNNPLKFKDPDGRLPVLIPVVSALAEVGLATYVRAVAVSGVRSLMYNAAVGAAGAEVGAPVVAAGATLVARDSLVGAAKGVALNAQKQAGHVPGTPQNINRIKQGKPTSSFHGEQSGEMATRIAHERGTPVPGRPNVKEYDFGVGVGTGPNGGTQTRVRVHESPKTGEIHGHPSGPEKF